MKQSMKPIQLLSITLLMAVLLSDCSTTIGTRQKIKLGRNVYTQVTNSDIPWQTVAESVQGRPIYLLEMGSGDSTTLIFGGFHGAEISGVDLVLRFAEYLYQEQLSDLNARVLIVPVLNPDGLVKAQRRNAHGVDINRNFPTANWGEHSEARQSDYGPAPGSEPETQAVIALLEKYQPQRIITVHAPLEVVNYDGPALALSNAMASHNGYPVDSDIGYATPGSFGTYAGKERRIPTITLELPRQASFNEVWNGNKEALLVTLDY